MEDAAHQAHVENPQVDDLCGRILLLDVVSPIPIHERELISRVHCRKQNGGQRKVVTFCVCFFIFTRLGLAKKSVILVGVRDRVR